MNRIKKILLILMLFSIVSFTNVFANAKNEYGAELATYQTSEGFKIVSYSKKWNTVYKLQQIRDELLSNTVSEELKYLKTIYIYPDSKDGVLGYTHCDIGRNSKGEYVYNDNTYIEIFDADKYNNISDMALVLSHEYGHHFTAYHMINKEKMFFDTWEKSGYANFRNPKKYPKIVYQNEYGNNLYRWDIQEIAAQDYVQLLGSKNARKSVIYKDIVQKINEGQSGNFNYVVGFNMNPQENKEIPLAADIKGLENYWRKLAGLQKVNEIIPQKPILRLVSKKEIAKGHYQYCIEWDRIPGNIDYEYTLIGYPTGPFIIPYPIKTVEPNNPTYAILGSGLKFNNKTGKSQVIIDEYQGRYTFVLYIKDNNNKVYASDPLEVNFNYPIVQNKGVYKDIHINEWAYEPIKGLLDAHIMVGSPDKYFYPLREVTFDEITTILDRIVRRGKDKDSLSFLELCLKNEIISKKEIDKLSNKKHMTREDTAFLSYKYLILKYNIEHEEIKTTLFKDDHKVFRKNEVGYLSNKGIIKGVNNYYYPQNNITRQELASIVVGLLNY